MITAGWFVLAQIVMFIVCTVQAVDYHFSVNYKADVAASYLDSVPSAVSIADIKQKFYSALYQLEVNGYQGAPLLFDAQNIWVNFDNIKQDIRTAINSLSEYEVKYGAGSDASYAYQQTLGNAKNSADDLKHRIWFINEWIGWNPYQNAFGFALWTLAFLIIPILVSIDAVLEYNQSQKEKRRYEEKWGKPRPY